MNQRSQIQRRARARGATLAAASLIGSAVLAGPALAGGGGGVSPTSHHRHATVPGAKAKLRNGLAIAPKSAPARVKAAINAANRIAKGHGYLLGGGHEYKGGRPIWDPRALAKYQGLRSAKYDCSGTVSYVLHAAGAIDTPEPSDSLEGWGARGKGKWITVYANGGHTFMTVAGLRFDTSDTTGPGPGWASSMGYESPSSYTIRHKVGL